MGASRSLDLEDDVAVVLVQWYKSMQRSLSDEEAELVRVMLPRRFVGNNVLHRSVGTIKPASSKQCQVAIESG